ncbi:MAG: HAD family phosphatase [Vicinamibacterales bacterium]
MIAAVIFDFDGVLADSEGVHLRAFQEVFAPRGWTLDAEAYFGRYLGYDDAGLLREYARDHGLTLTADDAADILLAKSRTYARLAATGGMLYPGAAACIARLGARFRLAIASGSLHDEIVSILETGNLRPAFSAVIGADDVERTKPDPEPYLAAAAALDVATDRCVVIEDSRWGVSAARAAGMRAIALTTTTDRADLSEAHLIVDGLDDIAVDTVLNLV